MAALEVAGSNSNNERNGMRRERFIISIFI
jgi:hypothetical protein